MIKIRDYQNVGITSIRSAFTAGIRAILYVLGTGGGKTIIFSVISHLTGQNKKRVLILVHRVELLRQTSKALMKFNIQHGMINPLFSPNYHLAVQVGSVQTVVNRLDKIQPPHLIIIDEAHHAEAGTWSKVLQAFPNARILGVTATPCREDGMGLGAQAGGWFEEMIQGPTVRNMIDNGYLIQSRIYAPGHKIDFSNVKKLRGDYSPEELEKIMNRPHITGDAVAHYTRICPGAPAIVFCVSIEHAISVAAEFKAAGYRAASVDGSMSDKDRQRLINGLGNGEIQVLTSCSLIEEGTDIPVVSCCILLRPTQSLRLYLQQVGRGGRPVYADGYDLETREGRLAAIAASGKPCYHVLDHVGNVITHGMPDDDRDWTLDGTIEKKKKKKGGQRGPAEAKAYTCDNCHSVHAPAPICAVCGHIYPKAGPVDLPTLVIGDLEELTPEMADAMKREKREEIGRARTLTELEIIEQKRGYKKGWAKHLYEARQEKKKQAA
jgi:DNA repair protein RadD